MELFPGLEKPFCPSSQAYLFPSFLSRYNSRMKSSTIGGLSEFKPQYLGNCLARMLELFKSRKQLFCDFMGVDRIVRIIVIVFG